jgi:hypothetical protein
MELKQIAESMTRVKSRIKVDPIKGSDNKEHSEFLLQALQNRPIVAR